MASSFSASASIPARKYDVFISFRGEDTHNNLRRGDEICSSLLKAIEESKLSVIVFSENYASSKWCLDELVKILECKEMNGQTVIPVFYHVNPSHVRNQTETVGDSIGELELVTEKMEKVKRWRAALKEVATLTGWDSRNIRSESELIEAIAGDILNKLYKMSPGHSMNLVGIEEHIKRTESLLCMDSQEPPSLAVAFTKDCLRRKKVLIVLDDVDNSRQLQELSLGVHDLFGPGSKILVTSRDKQVLIKNGVDAIYKVQGLNNHDALRLLSLNAFKKNCPKRDHIELLERMVDYAKGNPLALIVLGSSLYDRSKEKWYSALNKLGKVPNPEIQRVLRISYDGLDGEQQQIFLDIAFFFNGAECNHAVKVLDSCYSSLQFDLSILIDKSLITISQNTLEMHDILQEMAYSIVREESKNPGKRSRLCDHEDIYHVLKKKKGTEAVEGICLDISKMPEMHLESDTFARMNSLRFLKFYHPFYFMDSKDKVHLPLSGLKYLSDELKYLHWHRFPAKSLPQNFCAENIVDLTLHSSRVEQLWTGVQDLLNLRWIDLSRSTYLLEIPDLSRAKNLEYIDLSFCESLLEVHSSIQHLEKLEILILSGCKNLGIVPKRIESKFLRILDLSHCKKVRKCPEISGYLEELMLQGTAIEELPQSISKVKEIRILDLSGCSNITKFPQIPGNIKQLRLLWTVIEEVPSSIEFLATLGVLEMNFCEQLSSLPTCICKLKCLERLELSYCPKLESFPEILEPMESLKCLDLSGTAIKELPSSIKFLSCLYMLQLNRCDNLVSLPSFIEKLPVLKYLKLNYCKSLLSLPELPPSVEFLEAVGCESLETLSIGKESNFWYLNFANCFKLDQKPLLADTQMKIQSGKMRREVTIILPGSEIPGWFCDQSMGSSVAIKLPTNCHQHNGFAFGMVFVFPDPPTELQCNRIFICECHARGENDEHHDVIFNLSTCAYELRSVESDQMLLLYNPCEFVKRDCISQYSGKEISFEFYLDEPSGLQNRCKVKRCGVYLLDE
uniref:ADP-ribosyl cyclase/cyclic ADP-ribose hydrolase n=1 Tax=Populus trichocarpa TaxID=3694 RepID=A0A2K1WQT0_POPTR